MGKDVAKALGYQNPSKALADHVAPEDKLNNESLSSLGQRGGWLINESGLYILTGLTDPNFGLSKSHCFHGKVVY